MILRSSGVHVVAYDKQPSVPTAMNEYHGRFVAWSEVRRGDAAASAGHGEKVLLLCYPPPDGGPGGDQMGVRAIRSFQGDRCVYALALDVFNTC
jgi:hypothetical protein